MVRLSFVDSEEVKQLLVRLQMLTVLPEAGKVKEALYQHIYDVSAALFQTRIASCRLAGREMKQTPESIQQTWPSVASAASLPP